MTEIRNCGETAGCKSYDNFYIDVAAANFRQNIRRLKPATTLRHSLLIGQSGKKLDYPVKSDADLREESLRPYNDKHWNGGRYV